ncbi:MAG TPA: M20/M25/M40 family metallo-hydrolase [Planctomycetota bacterium]|nr:M20/M25/M40 family metallo-hydrolase [Planctomycetota bacterium]
MIDPVALLKDLVAAPSVSGSEGPALDRLEAALRGAGLETRRSGRNLWTSIGAGKPTLLLNAHIDTVPPTDAWTRKPFEPEVDDGRLYGLGSGDDKASIAAMAAAVEALAKEGLPGTIVFAATCDEETGGDGLETLRRELPAAEAAVIGEPTRLEVATAQRGLIRIEACAEGRAAHAARPHQGENAILKAFEDVQRLREMNFVKTHPLLGRPTVTVTQVQGGVGRNVVPPSCRFTVDVRTTPLYDNDWFVPELRRRIRSPIPVLKARMTPVETRADEKIVLAALSATGGEAPVGFGGVSDMFHVRDLPCVVLGPGEPEQSHKADESVPLDQVTRAAEVYRDLARKWIELKARRL